MTKAEIFRKALEIYSDEQLSKEVRYNHMQVYLEGRKSEGQISTADGVLIMRDVMVAGWGTERGVAMVAQNTITVAAKEQAWKIAELFFPYGCIYQDEKATEDAGNPVYSVTEPYYADWINDLGDCLDIYLHPASDPQSAMVTLLTIRIAEG